MSDLIQRLRDALAANPTPGPWITAGPSFGDPMPRYTTCIVQDTDDDCAPDVVRFMVEARDEQHELDAAFIAAACNAAPLLLDTIERLTAELAAAREPLTDEQIDAVTDQQWPGNINKPIYAAHRAYARAIERAIRAIGEGRATTSGNVTTPEAPTNP